jgi:hypothetical protein
LFSYSNLENNSIPNSVKYLSFYRNDHRYFNELVIPKDLKFILLGGCDKYSIRDIKNSKYILSYMYFYDKCTDLGKIIENDFYIKIIIDNITYKIHIHYLQEIIEEIERKNNIGNIIFKELTEKIFLPKRLEHFAKKYNLDLDEYIELI